MEWRMKLEKSSLSLKINNIKNKTKEINNESNSTNKFEYQKQKSKFAQVKKTPKISTLSKVLTNVNVFKAKEIEVYEK